MRWLCHSHKVQVSNLISFLLCFLMIQDVISFFHLQSMILILKKMINHEMPSACSLREGGLEGERRREAERRRQAGREREGRREGEL